MQLLVWWVAGAAAQTVSPACLAAVTVTDHRLEIEVSSRRVEERETWALRVDDPGACPSGVPAPPAFEGVESGELSVRDGLLRVPEGTTADSALVLERASSVPTGSHSGGFRTAPGLTTERAAVIVNAPGWMPLSVAVDSGARRVIEGGRVRTATVRWPQPQGAWLAWSTHKDWWKAADTLEGAVRNKVERSSGLGKPLTEGMREASVHELAARVSAAVVVDGVGRWRDVRRGREVVAAGSGTAAERALVLLSLLRAAGHKARPGVAGHLGPVPRALAAPDLLGRPVVAVDTPDGTVWIDPQSPGTPEGALPAALVGATAVAPGSWPEVLAPGSDPAGTVHIAADLELDASGSGTWTATVTPSGTAAEALFALDESWQPVLDARAGLVADQVAVGERAVMLSGALEQALRPLDGGLAGPLPALLAAGLAAALPPGLAIREELTVKGPGGVVPLAAGRRPIAPWPGHLLVGGADVVDGVAVLSTEVVRAPVDLFVADPGIVDEGPLLVLLVDDPKAAVRAVRSGGFSAGDARALEPLVWSRADDPKRLRKALKRALRSSSVSRFSQELGTYDHWGEGPLWGPLFDLAKTDTDRMSVVEALEVTGNRREAWRLAGSLTQSANPLVQVKALVAVARVQGPRPDATTDPDANAAWVEPVKLLKTAANRAAEVSADAEALVAVPLVEQQVLAGKAEDAREAMDALSADAPGPYLRVVRALARAGSGSDAPELLHVELADACAASGGAPPILALAARAETAFGHPAHALAFDLAAAQRARTDPARWLSASERALAAGELDTAVQAALRASDLDPKSPTPGVTLQILATLAGDAELAALAEERSGYRALQDELPAELEALRTIAADEHLLALLRAREADVRVDPDLLAERAELHRAAGMLDDAARDGALLARTHRRSAGAVHVFRAGVAQVTSSLHRSALDRLVRDPDVRRARMEYGLIAGTTDAASDAASLRGDARAVRVRQARTRPEEVAALAPEWPVGMADPEQALPVGYSTSRILGGPAGVVAGSDAERGTAVLRTERSVGSLPPPLVVLYEDGGRALQFPGGVDVRRLTGGTLQPFVASALINGQDLYGIGFSPEDARDALEAVIRPPPPR